MTCSIPGCDSLAKARGWCNRHWYRWRRHGDPLHVTPDRGCSVPGCGGRHYGRGWCNKHHARWYRTGDPLGSSLIDPRDRFETFLVPAPSGCVLWNGAISDTGYGNFWLDGGTVLAHRQAWIFTRGPIPLGLELDHLCRVRRCVNVAHLEPVTASENTRRQPFNCGRFGSRPTDFDAAQEAS